jgi:hypothetical protein
MSSLDLSRVGPDQYSVAHMCICATEHRFEISGGESFSNSMAHESIYAIEIDSSVAHTVVIKFYGALMTNASLIKFSGARTFRCATECLL